MSPLYIYIDRYIYECVCQYYDRVLYESICEFASYIYIYIYIYILSWHI